MLGRRIGSWIVERDLGRGGMGTVYKARHFSLDRVAAVKVLSPGQESTEAFRRRFRREAELQSQLQHPNIARVIDYVEDAGQWFLIIEYLDRGSLADLLGRGEHVTPQQAVTWTRQALAGLEHAHQRGVVHRDIKPANLMFNAATEIVVVDFGIARADAAPALTSTGVTVGTPAYMSPEQILTPDRVDGRADLYSLGIVLYELLVHKRPFAADSDFSILQAHVTQSPPPLRSINPAISPALEAVVLRALAKKPEERFPDCASFARSLVLEETRGTTIAVKGPDNAGNTVHESRFFDPSAPTNGASPAALREMKRRSFQRRLVTGVVGALAVAAIFAIRQGDLQPLQMVQGEIPLSNTITATTSITPANGGPLDTQPPTIGNRAPEVQKNALLTPNTRPSAPPVSPIEVPRRSSSPPAAAPAPAVPPLPEHPRIAVIGMGNDAVLAAALEQEMERRLASYDVADEHGDPDVDDVLSRKDVTPKTLGARLLQSGFHVLVLVRVEEGDRRSIDVRGQSLALKAARLRLNAYLLPSNRSLGSGWTEGIEYSELSAAAKARQAFIGATADLRTAIDDGWSQLWSAAAAGKTP